MGSAFELEVGIDAPTVQDRDARADVADGDDEVDGLVRRLRGPLAARNVEPDVVLEADFECRVFRARRDEQRALRRP